MTVFNRDISVNDPGDSLKPGLPADVVFEQ